MFLFIKPKLLLPGMLFAGILFTMGLFTSWEVPGCLQPVMMKIVPRRHLSSAFSWDVAMDRSSERFAFRRAGRTLVERFGAQVFASGNTIGPLLVGFIAQDLFKYHQFGGSVVAHPAKHLSQEQLMNNS